MIILFIISILVISIPFETVFPWFVYHVRQIDAKLEKPRSLIYLSKTPFWFGCIHLCNFLKGFLPLYIGNKVWEYNFLIIPLVLVMLWMNNWCLWQKFKNKKQFFFMLGGIYTFLHPMLGILYVIGYLILSLMFNSFVIGFISNILFLFIAFWFLFEDPLYLMLNMCIFILILFAYLDDLVLYFETGEPTIKTSFLNR